MLGLVVEVFFAVSIISSRDYTSGVLTVPIILVGNAINSFYRLFTWVC